MVELTLSRKQQQALELLDDPQVTELLFGGGAGGGKSWLVCLWAVIQCRKYPGITIGLGRKEITNLRKTTAQTLITEVHPALSVQPADFRYSSLVDPGVYYRNGSSIVFTDLAPAPTDVNFDRFGSLSLTHIIVEEAGEVVKKARSVITSRKNRKLNEQYGITGKAVFTCNPSPNFVRDEFYEPYTKLGGGEWHTWEYDNDAGEPVHVDIGGVQHRARRGFIRSLPTDNPFLSQNYIENLRSMPEAERRRLLNGDWDFDDDDSKLFKLHLFKTVPTPPADDLAYGGCDPSRGGDKTIFTAVQGNVVIDQLPLAIPPEVEDKGSFVAEHYIAFCQSHGISNERAAVDVVGIGASVQDACTRLRFKVRAFNAGSTKGIRMLGRRGEVIDQPRSLDDGIPLFNNIRSQGYYDMAQAAHQGNMLFLETLPYYENLRLELGAHHYIVKERLTQVEDKAKIKTAIGHSPDYADSLLAAWWVKNDKPKIGFRVRQA